MPRALISVSDKTGVIDFARELNALGWELVASGGTGAELQAGGLPVTSVESLTGQGELLGGRVKTLHPAIHSGILARDSHADFSELAERGYAPISLVACNLYPFREAVAAVDGALGNAIEQIDIGGVTLLRAAAKNFARVTVLCDPDDYDSVITALKTDGAISSQLRRDLAVKAFAHCRDYDTAIHAWLADSDIPPAADEAVPDSIAIGLQRSHDLRYGENPHQAAAYYSRDNTQTPLGARQLGGKQLSYNNILDVDAAWRAASSFDEPTAVIVKHLNPTGIASADTLAAAFPLALASDPLSAFGGIIALNRSVDVELVQALGTLFIEGLIAPSFTAAAIEHLQKRRANCRLLQMPRSFDDLGYELRNVMGGLLLQRYDRGDPAGTRLTTVTRRAPSDAELPALRFAWRAAQHVKSNAIVLAKSRRTVGIGGGLPSRVDAAELAISKAGAQAKDAALASDAFFPFPDSIERAAQAGVRSVIQPGGSIRDAQVIEAADRYDIAMVFTRTRHFRH
ncbi:MAG: bifunctional phosphoribosylaminoimidazolecarboxamide formyltransferase/IMP cyclohydrolase [Chloroflexi bacterium]|nr:bifunctional phosphoribosylaminoimidazolecarboxamide formyltransferase/IMP cyclohydrolase [Chloroflexota bacterium]MYH66265.1 bifunctional phosphoribosylaminoimidazolecarboxamide formyltransferase/IMP cyclohydrolase [Chloroflexota bacterium]